MSMESLTALWKIFWEFVKSVKDNIETIVFLFTSLSTVFLYFINRSLKRKLKETPVVARGLAVGYYYNFLKDIISQNNIVVRFQPSETRIKLSSNNEYTFQKDEVEIEFIVSKHLVKGAGAKANQEAQLSPKAMTLNPDRTINYDLVQRGAKTILIIRDPVRTYHAIYDYAAAFVKKEKHWQKLERETLSGFQEKLETISEGNLRDRACWKILD